MGKSEERRPPESGREPGENTAVAGLIMGIAAVVFWFFGYSAVASVVLGILGLIWTDKAKKEGYTGDKRTIAFVLSLVGLIGGLVVLIHEPVNQKAESIMKRAQMTLENHVSKQFDGSNLQGDTLVLTLNETIKNKVLSDYENVKNVYTINEFVGVSEELPNPYGKPLTAYGECFEILTGLIDKLADKLNSYAKGEE